MSGPGAAEMATKAGDGKAMSPPPPPNRYAAIQHLTEHDLARRWRMSERTLQAWRWKKIGPPFIRLQGKVLYRVVDVIEFEVANLVKGGG